MERIIGYQVGDLARKIKKFVDMHLGEVDLGSGQYILLRRIIEDPNVSQKQLSLDFDLNKATIARSIKKLIDSGYITREVNPEKPRFYKLIGTDRANKVIKEIDNLVAIERIMLTEGISDEELIFFSTIVKKMNKNISKELDKNEKRQWRD
ncbi:MAG: MarR family transcriptional regulator [Psychrilyobacter sp.]|nr:MarR family transcriptional regulator [Psychrilyobacter sp.]